jgi:hypothetical protein
MDDDSEMMMAFWEAILSEQPETIHGAAAGLDPEAYAALIAHLREMASGPGWQPGQARAARAALQALEIEI